MDNLAQQQHQVMGRTWTATTASVDQRQTSMQFIVRPVLGSKTVKKEEIKKEISGQD